MSQIVTQEQIRSEWSLSTLKEYLPADYFNEASLHSLILCSILVALQLLDAVLTISGVMTFGIEAEGNPMLHFLMQNIGAVPTIVLAKTIAIGIIGLLFTLSTKVTWIPKALYGMIAVYLFCAVIPWSYLLLIH